MHILILGLLAGGLLGPGDEPTEARRAQVEETWRKRLEPTQYDFQLVDSRGGVRFRGTLIARTEQELIFLTAAHCVQAEDRGRRIELAQGDSRAVLPIRGVGINPWREPEMSGTIPGSDNAILVVAAAADGEAGPDWLAHAPVARLAEQPTPGRDASTLAVFAIDQFHKPHLVRAGNLSNPRWLEWGMAYQPIPGDSGSGVFTFIAADNNDDELEALLIGVVTDKSPNGGGASVVAARDSWVVPWLPGRKAGREDAER